MPPLSQAERKLRAQSAAFVSWARTGDPEGRTRPARQAARDALDTRLAGEHAIPLDGTPGSARRLEAARRAYYSDLARRAARSRRLRREGGAE